MASTLGFEPMPQWGEASALTTAPPLLLKWLSDTLFACTNTQAFKINVYSQLSLRRTPLGPALAVRLIESQI